MLNDNNKNNIIKCTDIVFSIIDFEQFEKSSSLPVHCKEIFSSKGHANGWNWWELCPYQAGLVVQNRQWKH